MKTFKLFSLQVVEEDQLVDIELEDGLIISQENDQSTWLIEAYISKSYDEYFQMLAKREEDLIVQVVITKKENSPAAFQTKIVTIQHINDHISILLKGNLKKTNYDYAEIVLKKLINQGISGDKLLSEFNHIMRSKPQMTAAKDK
ncbi:YwpF family protein [Cytobacillus sp. FJAT-53684]|uniref:YwpF family protein n=1 Tax=Cytobacillus mangrovibacter TaxID=3299024 RepID=A0ABW6K567_9BACI